MPRPRAVRATPPEIHYTRSRDRGATFERTKTVSRGSAAAPAIGLDHDRVAILWEVIDDRRGKGLGIATSLDGGTRFHAELVPHSRDRGWNGSQQGRLMNKLAVRDGEIVVVNASLELDRTSRVWMLRGRLATSRGE